MPDEIADTAGHPSDFDWSLCRVFLAVARRGSIAAATNELGMTHPTVRRQLGRLEAVVGAPLFSRSQSGVRLTPMATALLVHCVAMEKSARSILLAASSNDIAGTVRIGSDDALRTELLPSVLRSLRACFPELRYEVVAVADDLLRRDCDVGLRTSRPTQERVVVSRIAARRMGLFASKSWIAEHGHPLTPAELIERRALIGDASDPCLAELLGLQPPPASFAVNTVDETLSMSLIVEGQGAGCLSMATAGRRDALVHLLPGRLVERDIWLSVHPDLRHVPHVRRVMDALRELAPKLLAA